MNTDDPRPDDPIPLEDSPAPVEPPMVAEGAEGDVLGVPDEIVEQDGLDDDDGPIVEPTAIAEADDPDRTAPAIPMDEPGLLEFESGPTTAPGGTADGGDAILAAISALDGRIEALQSSFERELRAESSREKIVDRLHAELQEYKDDLLLKVARPIFIDLIQLHDDMGKMADSVGEDRATGLLRDFQRGVEDILYRQGVEPFEHPGESFDPKRQRAVSTVPAEDPSLGKTIAARIRKGFASGEKVIRPELVSVYAARRP